MSECCTVPSKSVPPTCPMNSHVTKPVGYQTVEHLVTPEVKAVLLPQHYYFCDAPDCDVVYVSASGDHLITKHQLTVRVTVKETEYPIPLCYCFGYDRQAVHTDIQLTDIHELIMQRVRAGACRCEQTNPSGRCCLSSVAKAIQQAHAMKEQGLL